jgi:hypothetical protein
LDFDVPITFSILPRLPRSHHLASMIRSRDYAPPTHGAL